MPRVKDLALSLQRLRSLLCQGFDPWPRKLPRATGMAKKPVNYYVVHLILYMDYTSMFLKS